MEGVEWIPLHQDEPPGSGRGPVGAVVLIRMAPGRGYARHRHVGAEDVLVLGGGYRDESGEHRAGDHVHYPPGSVHTPVALGRADRPASPENSVCVLYSVVPGGIEYV